MTTLTIFTPEITTLETQLTALQTQLEELRQAEDIATQLLSTLADTLPRFEKLGAIARIKTALLGLFGETDAPKFENFLTEVPAAVSPTIEEIFDAECLPQPAPKQLTIEGAIASATPTPDVPSDPSTLTDAELNELETVLAGDTPLLEPAPTVEPVSATEQMNYIELVELTPTLAYQRKHDGEIVCAYLGSANKRLAEQWQDLLVIWGCDAQIRTQPKRLTGRDIKYEVKIRKITSSQLDTLKATHSSPFQGVPAPKATAQPKKPNESDAPHGQTPTGGSENDADNAVKPQVSLVLGKADNIYTTYHVYVEGKEVGRVERMSATTNSWTVPRLPGDWDSAEAAADALITKREADKKLHDDTNAVLRAKYGLPV